MTTLLDLLDSSLVSRCLVNNLESEEDVFSFMSTCKTMRDAVQSGRKELSFKLDRKQAKDHNKNVNDLVAFLSKNFPSLPSLVIEGCDGLTDLSGIGSLTQLLALELSECYKLTDLSGIGSLTQLKSMRLSGCSKVTNVSDLAVLQNVVTLEVSGCSDLSDVSGLSVLKKIKTRIIKFYT